MTLTPPHALYHYCERLGPGFWAEPVNALTNIAFIIAAAGVYIHLRRLNLTLRQVPDIGVLILLLIIIAIGSFLWHTLARPWAEWADVIPILIFISLYLLSFLIRIARLKLIAVVALFLLYHAINIGLQLRFPPEVLNGSMFYLPTLGTLLLMGMYCYMRHHPAAKNILLGGDVFALSLVFRTLDFALCPIWPVGTHFLWHILNAWLLYLVTIPLLESQKQRQHN